MTSEDQLLANARPANVRCTQERLIVGFLDGRELSVPIRWYPRLAAATPEQRADWEFIGSGLGIHWPQIDEDLSVKGLLMGWAAPGVVK
jgi:hypothetical protein